MASVFRPTYYKTDPRTGKRVKRRLSHYYVKYRDTHGQVHRVKGYTDKEATKQLGARLERNAARRQEGLADPFEAHHKRPLAEHLDDWRRHLEAEGNTPEYVAKVCARTRDVLHGCAFTFIPDLDAGRVASFLHGLRKDPPRPALPPGQEWFTPRELVAALNGRRPPALARLLRAERLAAPGNGRARKYPRATVEALQDRVLRGIGVSTSNGYVAAVRGFSRWLVGKERTDRDRLVSLSRLNADTDRRHERRALAEAELHGLLTAAQASAVPVEGLTGLDRSMLYATAMATGFRASELGSLYPRSFDLAAARLATATVKAACSKNRKTAVQPLPPDVAAALRGYLAGKPAGRPVWPGTWTKDAAAMLRVDLEAAGIPYRDADGRVADFHALRHSYITLLSRSGVSPRVAQTLARHSDIRLTMQTYTHAGLYDLAAAVDSLPPFLPAGDGKEAAALAATGTDGRHVPEHVPQHVPAGGISSDGIGVHRTDAAEVTPDCQSRETLKIRAFQSDTEGIGGMGVKLAGEALDPSKTPLLPFRYDVVSCLIIKVG
jgi:integrase